MTTTGRDDAKLHYIYANHVKNSPSGNESTEVSVRAKTKTEAKELFNFALKGIKRGDKQ